jgi:ABC-type spermidine/putrescine transport system permease subunit I
VAPAAPRDALPHARIRSPHRAPRGREPGRRRGGLGLEQYRRFLLDAFYREFLTETLAISLVTTAVCAVLAYPLAYQLARAGARARGLLLMLLIAPLMIGDVVRGYGWLIALGDFGVLNQALLWLGIVGKPVRLIFTPTGVVIGLVQVLLPFMVLPLAAAIGAIPIEVEEASLSLGARYGRVFRKIVLPLTLPGLAAGVVIVFALAMGSFAIPLFLGGVKVKMIGPLIFQQATLDRGLAVRRGDLERPVRDELRAARRLHLGGRVDAPRGGGSGPVNPDSALFKAATGGDLPLPPPAHPGRRGGLAQRRPEPGLPPTRISLRWFGAFLTSADFGRATRISLEVAAATALIALALGTAGRLRARTLPGAGAVARVAIPDVTADPAGDRGRAGALAALCAARRDAVGGEPGGRATWWWPYPTQCGRCTPAFATYDTTLDDAAATLGARPLRTFFRSRSPSSSRAWWPAASSPSRSRSATSWSRCS